jgi:hypothetical protein
MKYEKNIVRREEQNLPTTKETQDNRGLGLTYVAHPFSNAHNPNTPL